MESLRLFTSHSVLCEQVAQCFFLLQMKLKHDFSRQGSGIVKSWLPYSRSSRRQSTLGSPGVRGSLMPSTATGNTWISIATQLRQCSFKHRTEQYPYTPTIPSPLRQGAAPYKITSCIIQTAKVHSVSRVRDSMSGFHFEVDSLYFSATALYRKTSYIN